MGGAGRQGTESQMSSEPLLEKKKTVNNLYLRTGLGTIKPTWGPQSTRVLAVKGGGSRGAAEVLLGPLDVEDEVVVSKAGHPSNGSCGILTAVEADEGKALGEGGWSQGPSGHNQDR